MKKREWNLEHMYRLNGLGSKFILINQLVDEA